MASYELLDAVNTKDIRTTADIAQAMGVSKQEAARQLREAKGDGLVDEEHDESINVPPDFERWFWHLTHAGLAEWDRLDAERGS
jgi:DNA-binding MarR family transcriptional regulator